MNYIFKSILLLLSIITFSSCRNLTPNEEYLEKRYNVEYSTLFKYFYGWEWKFEEFGESESYDQVTSYPVPADQSYSIQFEKDGTFTAKAYCSSISGTYELDGTQISLSGFKVKNGTCSDNKFEKQFLEALDDVYAYQIGTNYLLLSYASDKWLMFGPNIIKSTLSNTNLVESFSKLLFDSAAFEVIKPAIIIEDFLFLTVQYRGSCQKHTFTLHAAHNTFDNSHMTLALDVLLTHKNAGDTCQDVISERLRFDLRPFKEVYRRHYDGTNYRVNLRIKGLNSQPEFTQEIVY